MKPCPLHITIADALTLGSILWITQVGYVTAQPPTNIPETNDSPPSARQVQAQPVAELIPGKVVWLAEALKRRYGISVVPEASQRLLALETTDGKILPLVEDARGRSFRKDERLRKMDLELLVRRYEGLSMIRVLRVYELQSKKRFIVDYWCDVCAIVMFEDGPCDCCQDHNQLRKRLADVSKPNPSPNR